MKQKIFGLLVATFMFSTLMAKAPKDNIWKPYNFKGTEHFKYSAKIEEGDSTLTGTYILDLKPEGEGKIGVHIKAKLGKSSFESTVTVNKDNIFAGLAPQLMFNPAASPLFLTIFAPWWGVYFMGHSWKVGSGWSTTNEEGKTVSFKIESECEHAGVKGARGIWRENGKIKADFCIATEVPLPLALTLVEDDGKSYQLVLEEYREK